MKKKLIVIMLMLGAVGSLQAQDINDVRSRAYSGDADAMYELSEYYRDKDLSLSSSWLKKAVENGSEKAIIKQKEIQKQMEEKQKYDELDQLKEKDKAEYFRKIFTLADNGDTDAFFRLGVLYDNGAGAVSQNTDEALSWYRKAIAIDESSFFEKVNVEEGPASRKIYEEYANNGNVNAMMQLAKSSSRDEALKWYKLAASKGNAEAKTKYDKIQAQIVAERKAIKEQQEREARERELQESTFRNFAGVWTCRKNITQFKLDSYGNAWFRNGSGYVWETLGVKYVSYNCIKVYDANHWHKLELSVDTMTLNGTYVYRRSR